MAKKMINYQALRAELDAILTGLEDDSLNVEEMAARYERGVEIVQTLEEYLKTAENKIQKIKSQWDATT